MLISLMKELHADVADDGSVQLRLSISHTQPLGTRGSNEVTPKKLLRNVARDWNLQLLDRAQKLGRGRDWRHYVSVHAVTYLSSVTLSIYRP